MIIYVPCTNAYIKYCIIVEVYNTETPRVMGKRKEYDKHILYTYSRYLHIYRGSDILYETGHVY